MIDRVVPNSHNLARTITDKQNKYQELANEMCAMWKQKAAQVNLIVISSTGVIPKSLSQSLTRLNFHPNTYIASKRPITGLKGPRGFQKVKVPRFRDNEYIYATAKICNSWHMFNCKKLFKLQIRPPSLILLITTSQDR